MTVKKCSSCVKDDIRQIQVSKTLSHKKYVITLYICLRHVLAMITINLHMYTKSICVQNFGVHRCTLCTIVSELVQCTNNE